MSLWSRLKNGLQKTAQSIHDNVRPILAQKIDDDTLEHLEDALIMADCGPHIAAILCEKLVKHRPTSGDDGLGVYHFLADEITNILQKNHSPRPLITHAPHVICMIGVNGTGKTTSAAKLAHYYKEQGHNILLGAGDTFRAAAIEQLQVWATRLDIAIHTTKQGSDAASLAYDTIEHAIQHNHDIVIFDTAGRLHTKKNLMDELQKIMRVMQKLGEHYPQETILVVDATSGQNVIKQIEEFEKIVPISGLIITKLDGSAKGGIVLAVANKFNYPIYAIGVGEQPEDLQAFDPRSYAYALLGIDNPSQP